jgi:5-(carboxyamino)imidazole ribonucleotide mutase
VAKNKSVKKSKAQDPQVSVIMGSDSDYEVMKQASAILREFGIAFEEKIISAHRTPLDMVEFAQTARGRGVRVIIAGAGGAAHLPGMVAAVTELPVIGVPVPHGPLQGEDALLSIVQMPKGVPVATVAIGGAANAALLAVQILAAGGKESDAALLDALADFKNSLRESVRKKKLR